MHCIKLLLYYPGKFYYLKLFIFMFNVVFSFAYLCLSKGSTAFWVMACMLSSVAEDEGLGQIKNSKLVFAVSLLSTQHYCVHPSGTRFRGAFYYFSVIQVSTKQISSH